ncbi:unnamed protein product [Rhizoctonia solani]|uniref:T6SS Phospholipase effector Tle1-like catalytic domain-containing protein n=1 Tax=Rhizoctonia solani TaxID=456999 RepID=A0A8H3HTC5_9AGAM|nr:unnamed protein product [Rhizoctonia solani]
MPSELAQLSFSRSLLRHERYSLMIETKVDTKLSPEGKETKETTVYVRAKPSTGDYSFKNPEEDTKFNLSAHIGFAEQDKLEWGLSGFHARVKLDTLVIRPEQLASGETVRNLCVELKSEKPNEDERKLNLDKYLDLYEDYDADSGELKAKLRQKPIASNRSIILCFDGTSNHFSNQNTNVVKLVELLKKDDPERQMVYYQPGVGTYTTPGLLTGWGKQVASGADQAIAWFHYQHVIDGYRYLMQTYRSGDQISLFGFSRGAYTARVLAGMLHSVGLLPRHNLEQASFAYEVYASSLEENIGLDGFITDEKLGPDYVRLKTPSEFDTSAKETDPRAFKKTFCVPVTITFLGVWDTVGSVGSFSREILPWIEYNPSVKHFRHALALDENRGNFIPSLWDHGRTISNEQDASEVWFKGGHSDIGGGAPPVEDTNWNISALRRYERDLKSTSDATDTPTHLQTARLSNITLRWMLRQCFEAKDVRIIFDPTPMRVYRDSGILERRPQSLKAEEGKFNALRDALDAHDIIKKPFLAADDGYFSAKAWGWWLLDRLPGPKPEQSTNSTQPKTVYSPNNGAPRVIQSHKNSTEVALHGSVYAHIEKLKSTDARSEKKYEPAAIWNGWLDENEWPSVAEGASLLMDAKSVQLQMKMKRDRRESSQESGMLNRISSSVRGLFSRS